MVVIIGSYEFDTADMDLGRQTKKRQETQRLPVHNLQRKPKTQAAAGISGGWQDSMAVY